MNVFQGSSLLALVGLEKKGPPELISIVGVNAIFVRKLFSITCINNHSPYFSDRGLYRLFQLYDGTLVLLAVICCCGTKRFAQNS